MHLSEEDAALFFKLMHLLHHCVNQQLGVRPELGSLEQYIESRAADKLEIRDAVYAHPELIERFIVENPAQFDPDELAIVTGWTGFITGDFFIQRHLRKYSIWIDEGSPAKVYAVIGLTQSIDEVIPAQLLPFRVRGVLLPFKGRIIYDGLLGGYNIFFGGGIKASLREEYMAAKQNGRIIESLEQNTTKKAPAKPTRDWRAAVDELANQAERLKGSATPAQSAAYTLLKASAQLAQSAAHTPDDLDALRASMPKVERAQRKLQNTLELMER